MVRTPPHILVTTPESLYLLLTSERSRERLRHVRTVIVDEIHAVIGTRRGAHLALSLERLASITEAPPLRIGLSATQRPVEDVARFLVGSADRLDDDAAVPTARVIDDGHRRDIDLAHRAARLAARSGDGARRVGGVLRPPGGADSRPSHHAGVRQHAEDGGARRPALVGSAGRRPGRRRTTAACRRNAASMPRSG